MGDKLFVKVYSLASWNDRADWRTPRPPEEGWNENRDFRTLEVSDAYPKYPSPAAMAIDMAVEDESLSGDRRTPTGASRRRSRIRNKGAAPSPEFGVYFYAGDPQKKGKTPGPAQFRPDHAGGDLGRV